MSQNRNGIRIATCIFEAACFHKSVRIVCGCGNEKLFQAHGLWWLFDRKCWSDEFRHMQERFYCLKCWHHRRSKQRPIVIEACERPATFMLPMPEEREWRRALSRFRS